MAIRAREFRYAIELGPGGRVTADGKAPLDLDEAWTPEHLLLAALVRCTIESLRFHARQQDVDFTAEGAASGVVTKHDPNDRYAFVEIDVELDVRLEPEPDDIDALLARAERDCFIGASLTTKPRYRWTIKKGSGP